MYKRQKLPVHCTVFQAEIKAILEASRYLNSITAYTYVKFFVDSQAAILALDNSKVTSTLVRDAKIELNKAAEHRSISLNWTRAHVGTEGNEQADRAAKEGGVDGTEGMIAVPQAELKEKIKSHFYVEWGERWNEYKGARMAKLFYKKPDSNQAKYVLKLGRLELSRFLRLISGHNGLFYFKNKIDPEINAICRFCLEAEETFYHLITDCPVFFESRREIFLEGPFDTEKNWSVRNMLLFSYLPGVREAIDGQTDLRLFGLLDSSSGSENFEPT